MAQERQTFVGLVALRVIFGCMGLFGAVFGVVVALTAESDGTVGDVAGAVTLPSGHRDRQGPNGPPTRCEQPHRFVEEHT